MNTLPEVRRLVLADAQACLSLSEAVNWKHGIDVWQQMIRLGDDGALGISIGDQMIATAIAIRYENILGWIGLVITHPDHQRRGLGKKIMQAAIAFLQQHDIPCVMLDATDFGKPLYEQLGFRSLYEIGIWTSDRPYRDLNTLSAAAVTIRPMQASDFAAVVALDAQLFGVARPHVLENHCDVAHVATEAGQIVGYFLNKITIKNQILGPCYHPTAEGAAALLQTTLASIDRRPLRLHIPESNDSAKRVALDAGFVYQRYCTRMVYGPLIANHMSAQYAIAAFATG